MIAYELVKYDPAAQRFSKKLLPAYIEIICSNWHRICHACGINPRC